MKSYALCPVTPNLVNEKAARLIAGFTTLILALFLYTPNIYLAVFLLLDFSIRAFDKPAYSPLALTSRTLLNVLSIQKQMINAGPKLLAARTGMLLSVIITVMTLAGLSTTALMTVTLLGIFSLLEAALGFCVACKIYPLLYRWLLKPADE